MLKVAQGQKRKGDNKSLTGEMCMRGGEEAAVLLKEMSFSLAVNGIRGQATMLAFVTKPARPRSQLSPLRQVHPRH